MCVHGRGRGCMHIGFYWAWLSSRTGTVDVVGGVVGWWHVLDVQRKYAV